MSGFFKNIHQKNSENTVGLLGTIAIHLIIIILFLSLKMTIDSKKIKEEQIVLDFTQEEVEVMEKIEEKKAELDKLLHEQARQEVTQELRRNIPVKAKQVEDKYNTKKYLKELGKQYQIESDQSEIPEPEEFNEGDLEMKNEPKKQKEKTQAENEEYKGPASVYYDLGDRDARKLPIPVYLCENKGKVVVNIKVDQKGYVVGTSINESQTEVYDQCLYENALRNASVSRFSTDYNAPYRQKGTITYIFYKQK
ncbi:MAG: hypothetical protein ACOC4B_01470 [Bacteroidota bacterium]